MLFLKKGLMVLAGLILCAATAFSVEAPATDNAGSRSTDSYCYAKAEVDGKITMLTAKAGLWNTGMTDAMKIHSDGSYVDQRPTIPGLEPKARKSL